MAWRSREEAPAAPSAAGGQHACPAASLASPPASCAGQADWAAAEEKLLRDVAQWLSPADLRRARLVCKTWLSALATLATRATTPPEASTVARWKATLEGMVRAMPCLQKLTIGSKLSSVGAQQLAVLADAKQLRSLVIPHGQLLQDRSLQALQPLAGSLRELHIHGAASLSNRSLLVLSGMACLEALELKHCGKVSWAELHKAWGMACMAYEASLAEAAAASAATGSSRRSSSGSGGSSGAGSSGHGSVYAKLGGWLPAAGVLFRTPGSSSNGSRQQQASSSSAKQRTGAAAALLARVPGRSLLSGGLGAIGNGRSSTGGVSHEGAVRKLLHHKQKAGAAAAAAGSEGIRAEPARPEGGLLLACDPVKEAAAEGSDDGAAVAAGMLPAEAAAAPAAALAAESTTAEAPRAVSSADAAGLEQEESDFAIAAAAGVTAAFSSDCSTAGEAAAAPRPPQARGAGGSPGASEPGLRAATSSALHKMGTLVWHGTTAAAAALSGGSSLTRQSSSVQAALMALLAEGGDGAAAAAAPGYAWLDRRSMGAADARSSGGGGGLWGGRRRSGGSSGSGSGGRWKAEARARPPDARPLPVMPFTRLVSLVFTCGEPAFKSPAAELAAVAALTGLTHLEMGKCKLPDAVFGQLRSLTRLSKLKLSGLWAMGDAGVREVAALSSLQSLALSEPMHMTAAGLAALRQLSGLTSLALALTQDLGSGAIAHAVSGLPALRCLEVAASCWDDDDCWQLAAAAAPTAAATSPEPGTPRATAGSDATADAAAAAAAGQPQQQLPVMLWQLSLGQSASALSRSSSSRSPLGGGGGGSSAAPLAGAGLASRSNSAFNMRAASRAASFSSMASFGSFSSYAPGSWAAAGGGCDAYGRGGGGPAAPTQALAVLKLHGCTRLSHRGLEALRALGGLSTLSLDGCRAVHASEAVSQDLLPPRLLSLSLKATPFGNAFAGCVGLPACGPGLTRLELVAQGSPHVGQLRRTLSCFPCLRELNLSGCAELGEPLLAHLALLPGLTALQLAGTRVSGEGFDALAALPALHVLGLRGCASLADAGLAALEAHPALAELDVAECGGLSGRGLLRLVTAATGLVRLDVSGCRGAGRELLAACPHHLQLRHSLAS